MTIWTGLWTAILILLIGAPVQAMKPYRPTFPNPEEEPWRWRTFPELKGLGLRCLAEGRDGALWFGCNEGVKRYDGLGWTAFTPEDGILGAPVNALGVSRDGRVYAGTDWGISVFDGTGWQRLFPPQGDLPWPIDRILEASDGRMGPSGWADTTGCCMFCGMGPGRFPGLPMYQYPRPESPIFWKHPTGLCGLPGWGRK